MKKMLPVIGLMTTVACTEGPPLGTKPLTEEQKQEVRQDLDRLHSDSGFVKDLLLKADPLFDIQGEDQRSNEELIDGIDVLEGDLDYFLENDHFVIAGSSTELEGWNAKSVVGKDAIITDNYIILQPDPSTESGLSNYGTYSYMHEAAHSYYDPEQWEHNHIQEEVESGKWKSIDEYILETNDVSYLMTSLYRIDAYDGSKLLSELGYVTDYEYMREDPEANYDEEKLDKMYRFVYEYSHRTQEEYLDEFLEDWFGEDTKSREINIWDYYAFIGISRYELQELIVAHPELQESKRETAYWILDGLTEIYPEQVAEIKREILAEQQERTLEIGKEGSRR
jgi:hypothetical protein